MFPHATCFCIKNQQQIEHEQRCQFQNQVHLGTKYANHCETNPWIIQRRADFVKINVLSSSQASLILQQTKRQLYNEQVSHIFSHSWWMNFSFIFHLCCFHFCFEWMANQNPNTTRCTCKNRSINFENETINNSTYIINNNPLNVNCVAFKVNCKKVTVKAIESPICKLSITQIPPFDNYDR